jgi:hypothetical protein
MYRIEVENEQIWAIINQSDICFAKLDTDKRTNLFAIAHIYISTNQTIAFNDFVFDMMTDGINDDMGVPTFVLEEVSKTNGKIYYDRQVFNIVKHVLQIYDKKILARLLYYQPVNNKLFDLLMDRAMSEHGLDAKNAEKLATELCRFSTRELAIYKRPVVISNLL